MQNTILIHAPGRRQGRGALVLAYTALFALLMGIWAAIFALNGQSFIQYGDTLKQHYPFLVYYGRWLRQAARCVLTGAAVPTWDFSIGYGADIITTLSYYGLGDPLDLLAAFVPGRWTEQLLEGLIVLRLYLAGAGLYGVQPPPWQQPLWHPAGCAGLCVQCVAHPGRADRTGVPGADVLLPPDAAGSG